MFSLSFLKPPGHTSFALHLVKKLRPLQYDVLCYAWNWRTRTDRSKSEQQQSAILPYSQKWREGFRVSVLLFASTLNPQTLAFVNPQPSVPLCVCLSLSLCLSRGNDEGDAGIIYAGLRIWGQFFLLNGELLAVITGDEQNQGGLTSFQVLHVCAFAAIRLVMKLEMEPFELSRRKQLRRHTYWSSCKFFLPSHHCMFRWND